jgi:serine/threonine protein phosphatase PrpC
MIDDTTAEFTQDQLAPPVELRTRVRATVAGKTDLGRVRENNEDKFEFYVPEDPYLLASRGSIYLVCDGMGGYAAGQIASEISCKTFIDVYLHHPAQDPDVAITSGVIAANRYVLDNSRAFPDRKGMGTTLVGLILLQDRYYTVQVGDSRIYRLRDGECVQLTTDHTWVEEALSAGVITPAEAENHPYKHVITRAIGAEPEVRPTLANAELKVGDIFMLCSDGLVNHVDNDAIGVTLRSFPPAEAAWRLVGAALQGGGTDNTTVLIVRVDALDPVGL